MLVKMTFDNFKPWGGAVNTYLEIVDRDLEDEFDSIITEMFPEGIEFSALNDLLWFEDKYVMKNLLGVTDYVSSDDDGDNDTTTDETEENLSKVSENYFSASYTKDKNSNIYQMIIIKAIDKEEAEAKFKQKFGFKPLSISEIQEITAMDYIQNRHAPILEQKEIKENLTDFDEKTLKDSLLEAVKDVMLSPSFGYDEDEVSQYSTVEIYNKDDNRLKVEIRAEVGYNGLEELANVCNPIIKQFDPNAYFDFEEPGIMSAYIEL